jgi:hypothetical protein
LFGFLFLSNNASSPIASHYPSNNNLLGFRFCSFGSSCSHKPQSKFFIPKSWRIVLRFKLMDSFGNSNLCFWKKLPSVFRDLMNLQKWYVFFWPSFKVFLKLQTYLQYSNGACILSHQGKILLFFSLQCFIIQILFLIIILFLGSHAALIIIPILFDF